MGFSKDLKEIIMMRMALKEKKRQEEKALPVHYAAHLCSTHDIRFHHGNV